MAQLAQTIVNGCKWVGITSVTMGRQNVGHKFLSKDPDRHALELTARLDASDGTLAIKASTEIGMPSAPVREALEIIVALQRAHIPALST